jgi:protein-tyrosine phosphatase
MSQKSVLLVCLGNICRSPLAEAALRAEAVAQGLALTIDSAGTSGMHTGQAPDPRAQAEALRHGIDISTYRARKLTEADFHTFGHIFAMDQNNLRDMRAIAPSRPLAHFGLLMDAVPGKTGMAVPDPYYGDEDDFADVWDQVSEAAKRIVAKLAK